MRPTPRPRRACATPCSTRSTRGGSSSTASKPRFERLRAAPEAQRQIVQTADQEARQVGEGARVDELDVVEPREQPLDADARLGAGEGGAGTEMRPVTERDVAAHVRTLRIEAVAL